MSNMTQTQFDLAAKFKRELSEVERKIVALENYPGIMSGDILMRFGVILNPDDVVPILKPYKDSFMKERDEIWSKFMAL